MTERTGELPVMTIRALKMVHDAFQRGGETDDVNVLNDAETIYSALLYSIRHPMAVLPGAVRPAWIRLVKYIEASKTPA